MTDSRAASHGAVREVAPAKINLYLHVLGTRSDGRHLVDSLVAFAGVVDGVTAAPAADLSLAIDGPFAAALESAADNLVYKAAQSLARHVRQAACAHLTLTKNLPVSAGLGGGSADAAAALRALTQLWQVRLGEAELMTLSAGLGADVPACSARRPVYVGGVGEQIVVGPPLPRAELVLVNPGAALPTRQVFLAHSGPMSGAGRDGSMDGAIGNVADFARWLATRRNDLTDAAARLVPQIRDVLAALEADPACLLARMSGSGATCFGLYADASAAAVAVEVLSTQRPAWWITHAPLLRDGVDANAIEESPVR